MTTLPDFRLASFDPKRLAQSGRYIGHHTYWKLYCFENLLRVVIHSILTVTAPPNWWEHSVAQKTRTWVEEKKVEYSNSPRHGKPGKHGIYYLYLRDLNEILRANAHLFRPVIQDIDSWRLRIEDLGIPRNIVAHMNFPSKPDMKQIDGLYDDCLKLVSLLAQKKIPLKIP
jgi:hypothetical protein